MGLLVLYSLLFYICYLSWRLCDLPVTRAVQTKKHCQHVQKVFPGSFWFLFVVWCFLRRSLFILQPLFTSLNKDFCSTLTTVGGSQRFGHERDWTQTFLSGQMRIQLSSSLLIVKCQWMSLRWQTDTQHFFIFSVCGYWCNYFLIVHCSEL